VYSLLTYSFWVLYFYIYTNPKMASIVQNWTAANKPSELNFIYVHEFRT